jgi:hypothetical protein
VRGAGLSANVRSKISTACFFRFNQDLIRGSYYNFVTEDLWHFDNPGDQEVLSPMQAPVAIFDSDSYSATDNLPENVALTSPIFDTRGIAFGSSSIVIDWDQSFVEGYEAKIFVEVWTGHSWAEVYSETATTFNPDHQMIDITCKDAVLLACLRACVRACLRACVRVCVRACVFASHTRDDSVGVQPRSRR